MRDVVTKWHRFSLAGRKPRIMPEYCGGVQTQIIISSKHQPDTLQFNKPLWQTEQHDYEFIDMEQNFQQKNNQDQRMASLTRL